MCYLCLGLLFQNPLAFLSRHWKNNRSSVDIYFFSTHRRPTFDRRPIILFSYRFLFSCLPLKLSQSLYSLVLSHSSKLLIFPYTPDALHHVTPNTFVQVFFPVLTLSDLHLPVTRLSEIYFPVFSLVLLLMIRDSHSPRKGKRSSTLRSSASITEQVSGFSPGPSATVHIHSATFYSGVTVSVCKRFEFVAKTTKLTIRCL